MSQPEFLEPYDPEFLGDGFWVPMPTAAVAAGAVHDSVPIAYTHFSLLLHAKRRVPIFAAYNNDAARGVMGVYELEWTTDERVGENQLGPEVVDAVSCVDPLVMPNQVAWGSVPEARAAAKATFFYTNVVPRHNGFIENGWADLEKWVLSRRATDFCYRLCVFAGPVLRDDDLFAKDLPTNEQPSFSARGQRQIPAGFWKVIVLRDSTAGGDDLAVLAFVCKQSGSWDDEDGSSLQNLSVHQVSLSAIERWTKLDFGNLKNADEMEWSELVERAKESNQPVQWPTINCADDILFTGVSRRAQGMRALRRGGTPTRNTAGHSTQCGCDNESNFEPKEAIAALNRDMTRLTEMVAALQINGPVAGERSLPTRTLIAADDSNAATNAQDDALSSIQQRADRMAASVPESHREKVREFARRIAVQSDVTRGILKPEVAVESYRIVGGNEVASRDFPTCCCVGDANGWFCTGTVIAPRVVVTAAHCGMNISRVMVGGNRVVPFVDPDARQIAVRRVHVHDQYRRAPFHEYDITLLVLASPANVHPTPLVIPTDLGSIHELELVGFGYNDPSRPLGFGVKRRVTVPLGPVKLNEDDDFGDLVSLLGFHPEYELVAGRKGMGKDSCNGDSGGPAFFRKDGQLYLAGVTSRATREATVNCGDGGIYVRPDIFRDWINEIMQASGLGELP